MRKIKLKLNQDLRGRKAGEILSLEVDRNRTIKDSYWRRRLEDAAIDNCVEVVKNTSKGDKS